MNSNTIVLSTFLTMTGVLMGIKAVYGGVRLDWPETVLIAGVVCITVGIVELIKHTNIKEGEENE